MSLRIGIDVGGTNIKGVLLDGRQKTAELSLPTNVNFIDGDIAAMCAELLAQAGADKSSVSGVGIAFPGTIDSARGRVVFAGNLKLRDYPIAEKVRALLNLPVKVVNDANAAALGEAKCGAGKKYSDSVFVTIGTGVGGGVIIGGKLFEGFGSAGTEIGHMTIVCGGDKCTCGRRGCFEAYASASALEKRVRWAMEEDAGSAMWQSASHLTATCKTAFDYADCDQTAKEVLDWYIKRLGCGLVSLANIFRPQAIIIGGGISAQGEKLIQPLRKLLDKEIFGGQSYAPVEIVAATLGNEAGAYGAANLFE